MTGFEFYSALWPGLLERLLSRLDSVSLYLPSAYIIHVAYETPQIIHNDFPKPIVSIPPPVNVSPDDQAGVSASQGSSQESQTANKENAPPQYPRPNSSILSSPPTLRPVPGDRAHQETVSSEIFPELNSIRATLTTSFATSPPHTVQRLAELILRPRLHFRFVGPYLRAVDRVVSVSSGTDRFPPMSVRPAGLNGAGLPNGTSSVAASGSSWSSFLDGDDSLGGALLTPVSWLQAEQPEEMLTEALPSRQRMNGPGPGEGDSAEADHGMVDDEGTESLRELGAVTQGELLRQEQEAGVVPTAEPLGRQSRSGTTENEATMEDEEPHPHVSGPDEVGIEDMGPQEPGEARGRFDVDVALGRKTPSREVGETAATGRGWSEEQRDMDDDVILTDVDGKPDEDTEQTL